MVDAGVKKILHQYSSLTLLWRRNKLMICIYYKFQIKDVKIIQSDLNPLVPVDVFIRAIFYSSVVMGSCPLECI